MYVCENKQINVILNICIRKNLVQFILLLLLPLSSRSSFYFVLLANLQKIAIIDMTCTVEVISIFVYTVSEISGFLIYCFRNFLFPNIRFPKH